MSKEVYIKTYQNKRAYEHTADFNGSTSLVTVPYIPDYNITGALTIEAWINVDALSVYFICGNRSNTTTGYGFYFVSGALQFTRFGVGDIRSTTISLKANTWYHVAIVYDSSSDVSFYVNGEFIELVAGSGTTISSTADFIIGKSAFGTASYFNGGIQEVRLWNIARTATEIRENVFKQLEGTEANLQAYFKLSEGSGTNIIDYSNNSNDATSSNITWVETNNTSGIYTRKYKGFSDDYVFDSITSQVNSGYGALTFTLPREFDVLRSQDPQNLKNYELDVVAYDTEQSLGVILFSGEVIIDDRKMSADKEEVVYTASSPLERLEKIDLVEPDSIVSYSNVEISEIFKDIIIKCNARAGKQILKFSPTSLENTSKNITITFNNANVGDALKSVYRATDTDWVWFVDVDKTVFLKKISSTPDHYFLNSKDITSINRTRDRTKIINSLKFWDGKKPATISREYVNQDSINDFGLYVENKRDSRYTNTSSADFYGLREVEVRGMPNDQLEFTIIDSSGGGIDIDKIKVGDTFKALNFSTEVSLPDLMIVTQKIDYLDYCVITASDRETYISRELFDLKKDQDKVNYENGIANYTTINL